MENYILKIENGCFSYDDNKKTLNHINFEVKKGEKIAIIGNNGAGKSTFFLTLNGVLHYHTGSMYLHGNKLDYGRKNLLTLRKSVGMVFQNPDDQIIGSTVTAEISFGLFNMGLSKEVVKTKVEEVIHELQLEAYRDRPPHYLSGGEKKRVCIADIIVMEPEIILFDEPMASLDNKNIKIVKSYIEKLYEKGVTLLISTHDMNFVWEWADRVIVFHNGTIVADDKPEAIFRNKPLLEKTELESPILLK